MAAAIVERRLESARRDPIDPELPECVIAVRVCANCALLRGAGRPNYLGSGSDDAASGFELMCGMLTVVSGELFPLARRSGMAARTAYLLSVIRPLLQPFTILCEALTTRSESPL
jgi:hypothetical protein